MARSTVGCWNEIAASLGSSQSPAASSAPTIMDLTEGESRYNPSGLEGGSAGLTYLEILPYLEGAAYAAIVIAVLGVPQMLSSYFDIRERRRNREETTAGTGRKTALSGKMNGGTGKMNGGTPNPGEAKDCWRLSGSVWRNAHRRRKGGTRKRLLR